MSVCSTDSSDQVDYIEEHAILHGSITYMAHRSFLSSTTWYAENEHSTKTLFDCKTLSAYVCVLTGTVSKSNSHLSMMGDCLIVGDPPRPSIPPACSCIRFSLEEPTNFSQAPFAQDFRKFVEVTHDMVDAIPGEGNKGCVSPFLTRSEDGRWHFNFEFEIFRDQDFGLPGYRHRSDPLELDTYAIDENYQPFIEDIKYMVTRRLPVWDHTGEAIEPEDYAGCMKDSLVEVHITLAHDNTSGLNAELKRISIISPCDD